MAEPEDHGDLAGFLRGGGATGDLIARFNWAATSLGPLSAWPQCLKTATSIVLRSPVPMALMWGEDGVMLYNDAYADLIGRDHPRALGAPIHESWPELAEMTGTTLATGLAGDTRSLRNLELTVNRAGQPQPIWHDVDCSPVLDELGRPAGVLIVNVDATQRVLAERKAALELARIGRIFEQAPGFICLLSGPNLIVQFVNEAHKRLFGDRNAEGRPYMEAFADVASVGAPELIIDAYATGERYVARAAPVLIPTADGGCEEHLLDVIMEPMTDDDGQVTGIFVEGFDVTEQVRAQAAAEESERRLSAAVAIARLGAFEWDLETGDATLDDRAREIFGFGATEVLRISDVVERIEKQDWDRIHAEQAAYEAAHCARREFEYRIRLSDGTMRNIATVSDTVAGPDGRTRRIVGVFDDVTEQRAAERRQRMLINELNHRVKNTLATVQSIAAQTLRSAPTLPAARDSFESRLVALAAAHDLLTAQNWHGARLADVVATAMAPFETVQRPQISRSGPPVWLTAQRALALSLALHELATNAAKYGALSVPQGRVTIRWNVAGDELRLSWIEQGGPPVAPPTRVGFGTRLLQRGLAHELHGEVALTFPPGGVRCEVRCGVEEVRAPRSLEIAEAAGTGSNA
jgi:PAS domain S-box-containing protein